MTLSADTLSLREIATLPRLYSDKLIPHSDKPLFSPSSVINAKVCLLRHDITKISAIDAIVNAANKTLLGGGGVDAVIHLAAGPGLLNECKSLHGCETGEAVITRGYNLPCKYVIHTVGPIYRDTKALGVHANQLASCYRKSLQLAVDNKCQSIAFPCISTGVYGYPSEEAVKIALNEVRSFLNTSDGSSIARVVFCTYLPSDESLYRENISVYFPQPDHESSDNARLN